MRRRSLKRRKRSSHVVMTHDSFFPLFDKFLAFFLLLLLLLLTVTEAKDFPESLMDEEGGRMTRFFRFFPS